MSPSQSEGPRVLGYTSYQVHKLSCPEIPRFTKKCILPLLIHGWTWEPIDVSFFWGSVTMRPRNLGLNCIESHCNKLRVTVRRRTESSISLYELPVDFLHPSANWVSFVHFLGISKPIKAFLLTLDIQTTWWERYVGPRNSQPPNIPQNTLSVSQ